MWRWLILLVIILPRTAVVAQVPDPLQAIDNAYAITFRGWSPDGQWMAYFSHRREDVTETRGRERGDLHFYNVLTGEVCVYRRAQTDDIYQNGDITFFNAWLPDGRYLTIDGVPRAYWPCATDVTDLSGAFDERIVAVVAISQPASRVLLHGERDFWLYDLSDDQAVPVRGIDPYDAVASGIVDVSPDGQRIALTFEGVASTYIVDTETGLAHPLLNDKTGLPDGSDDIILRTRPRWLTNRVVYVPYTSAAGGVIADAITGEWLDVDEDLPIEDAAGEAGTEVFHVALTTPEGTILYHSESDTRELLEGVLDIRLSSNGRWVLMGTQEGTVLRHIDDSASTAFPIDISYEQPSFTWTEHALMIHARHRMIVQAFSAELTPQVIETDPDGWIIPTRQSQGLDGLSPDERYLAVIVTNPGWTQQTLALLTLE